MAITAMDRLFWLSLRDDGLLPERPDVLEIGQANWYGDCDPAAILDDILRYGPAGEQENEHGTLKAVLPLGPCPFSLALFFYRAVLHYRTITAIDLHGRDRAVPHDLNTPLPPHLAGPFGIVINTGTAEHVFDQRQLFESIHDACAAGGLMVHMLPLWGWLDHGFVNYHPTFVADLAAANGYEVVRWWVYSLTGRWCHAGITGPGDIHRIAERRGTGDNSVMHAVALRKRGNAPFRVPTQGYYAGTLSAGLAADWSRLR